MSEILGALRAAAITAFIAGLGLLLLDPPSLEGLRDLLVVLVVAVAFLLVMAWATVALIGDEMPEPEFRRLVDRSEALALLPPPDQPPSEFDTLVMEALDDLPEQFRELLAHTPVVVSSRGNEHHAYGHYIGGTIARDTYQIGSSSTRTRWSATSATIPSCSGRRWSAPCATRWPTTWAGVNAEYAASVSETTDGPVVFAEAH